MGFCSGSETLTQLTSRSSNPIGTTASLLQLVQCVLNSNEAKECDHFSSEDQKVPDDDGAINLVHKNVQALTDMGQVGKGWYERSK